MSSARDAILSEVANALKIGRKLIEEGRVGQILRAFLLRILGKKPHEYAPSNSICHLIGISQQFQPPFSQQVAVGTIGEPKMLTKRQVPIGH